MTLQAEQALADSVQEAHSHAPTEGDKVVCVSELASFTQMESRDVRTQQFSHKLQVRANPLQDARVSAALCDSSPAVDLAAIIRKLKNHFDHYFYELEPKVVKKFTQRAQKSATVSLKQFSPKIKIVREGKCAGGTQPRSANAVKTTLFTSESECQAGCMTERSSKMSEGFSINFRLTRQMNDILQATIAENVGLIKSIHTAYFNQVQEIVIRG